MKWTIETARKCISHNGGNVGAKQVMHSGPGLRVLGAIDYLVYKHKYTWVKGRR